ncbi:unnamed protein product [Strongylus vulgaris]|uniref:Uncharacterized protein n=1 Tax=Strongylus vulgaris TaxID=40348 RepID=A0A3P7KEP3_STRVU|nr:unnamed protein product [Strongylus vulgaris]
MTATSACPICQKQRPKRSQRLTTTDIPTNVILLSTLARYRIDLTLANKIFSRWERKIEHICISHLIEATFVLLREIQQLLGSPPENSLSTIPEDVLDEFVAHVRMYGSLIGNGFCLEREHVVEFFDTHYTKYHAEVLNLLGKDRQSIVDSEVVDAEVSHTLFRLRLLIFVYMIYVIMYFTLSQTLFIEISCTTSLSSKKKKITNCICLIVIYPFVVSLLLGLPKCIELLRT